MIDKKTLFQKDFSNFYCSFISSQEKIQKRYYEYLKSDECGKLENYDKFLSDNIEVLFLEGCPVTARINGIKGIKGIKQPYGGFLPIKSFKKEELGEGELDYFQDINVNPSIIGLAVDYLKRFVAYRKHTKKSLKEIQENAFSISLKGVARLGGQIQLKAMLLLRDIKGLDDVSIRNACKLSGFDCIYRSNFIPEDPISSINPDKNTIKTIKVLVERTLNAFGNKKVYDITTFDDGLTKYVSDGDCDFLTEDTLWDLKVIKSDIKSAHTLQLFMYYLLGINSIHKEYQNVKYLGLFNPRKNLAYKINVKDITPYVYSVVSSMIIGYQLPEIEKKFGKILRNGIKGSELEKNLHCFEFVIGEVLGLNFNCFR